MNEILNETSKRQVRWLIDRLHVSTPDSEVANDIATRLEGQDPYLAAQATVYALECHRANRDQYHAVMGPAVIDPEWEGGKYGPR